MRIWLFAINETWPTDGSNPRLLRTGVMAQRYARAGDDIVWFNSSFWHAKKTHRFRKTTVIETEPRLTVVGLYGRAYQQNISLARIAHNWQVAREFKRLARGMAKPDIIVASWPMPELATAAMRYGKSHDVPVIVDIRDFWPEIWLEISPRCLLPAARVLLHPYYAMLRHAVDRSAALVGVSDLAVEWGLQHGTRARKPFDGPLPLAYETPPIDDAAMAAARQFWADRGIAPDSSKLTICYFGNISRRYEFDTVFQAIELMSEEERSRVRIVLCGVGERYDALNAWATKHKTILMPGWMDSAQIESLKQISDVGLLPYPSSEDYIRSLPNKSFDYLVGNLPILTSLKGLTDDLIRSFNCGWRYENNDAKSLVAKLRMLCDNPALVRAAAEGSTRAAVQFSADQVYGRFHDKMKQLVRQA